MATDYIVGIDLGTTNSLVAYMQGDSPVVIPGEDGLNLVPSVVALDEKNQIIVGNAARKYLIETPERAVYSVKRLMGRGVEDIQQDYPDRRSIERGFSCLARSDETMVVPNLRGCTSTLNSRYEKIREIE